MALNKFQLYSGPVLYVKLTQGEGVPYTIYYTLDGITISCETEWADLQIDQIPGAVKKKKLHHRFNVSFKVPELNLNNAQFAFSQPDANLVGANLTVDNDSLPAINVKIAFPESDGRMADLEFYEAYCLGIQELVYNKGTQTCWEIKLQAIYSAEYGAYGLMKHG
jgi:hypothetical protein